MIYKICVCNGCVSKNLLGFDSPDTCEAEMTIFDN